MPDIVISEFMDEAAVADLARDWSVLYDANLVSEPARLLSEVAACRALVVRNLTQVRGPLLAAAAKLEVVGRLGVGLDNIDLDACAARGIAVLPATGANDGAVAEYVIAAVLMLLRGAYQATPAVIAGQWPRGVLMGREVAGTRLGLIGYGGIARQVATRARALGLQVSAFDPFLADDDAAWQGVERTSLEQLLSSADAVSLHVPYSRETHGLIDESRLALLKPDAVLINTARGGVVEEAALVDALRTGRLAGAALDVFAEEPLSAEVGALFAGLDNLILTPHIAGVTAESNQRVSALTAENVRAVLEQAR